MNAVRDLMTTEVKYLKPDTSVQQAASKMKSLGIGSMPVYDGDSVVGMITDRDIAIRSTAAGDDPSQVKVEQVMTRDVECCRDDEPLSKAVALMQTKQIKRLPIVDSSKSLVGMLSFADVARNEDERTAGQTAREISKPDR